MTTQSGFHDQDPKDWEFRRYRVSLISLFGTPSIYGVYTRCGEYKAVALALRNHLLGKHGFFEDFPLSIRVEAVADFSATDLVEMEASDLGDLNEG